MRTRDPSYERSVRRKRGEVAAKRAGSRGPKLLDASGGDVTAPDIQFIGATVSGDDDELAIVTITGTGQQVINDSGSDLEYGMVVVRQSDGSVTTTTTERDTRPVGVVQIGGADTNPVSVVFSGDVAQIETTGTVAAGDYLETSTTAGKAQSSGTSRRSGTFGRALDADPDPPATLFGVTDAVTGSVGGSGQPWLYAQADGGLVGDGVTDDTAALQALIDTATASGTQSGWIFFEPGVYLIGGALQDTGAFNAQILLPNVTSKPGITLTMSGPSRPFWEGTEEGGPGDAVLKSTLTGASGSAAVFSGGNSGTNYLSVVLKDLRCVAPADPTFTFWNLSRTFEGSRSGLMVSSDGSLTQPTSNSSSYGIRLPASGIGSKNIEDIFVIGFYGGVQAGELTYGHLNAWYCAQGVVFNAAGHLSDLVVQTLNCPYHIVVFGGDYYGKIRHDVENKGAGQPAWTATVAHLYDPSNLAHVDIDWTATDSGVGQSHTYTISGGSNVNSREIGSATSSSSSGGLGPLLIASDHSSPIVFADLLQASDGDDFLYGSTP